MYVRKGSSNHITTKLDINYRNGTSVNKTNPFTPKLFPITVYGCVLYPNVNYYSHLNSLLVIALSVYISFICLPILNAYL